MECVSVCTVRTEHFNSAKESFADWIKLAIVMTQFILYELLLLFEALTAISMVYNTRLLFFLLLLFLLMWMIVSSPLHLVSTFLPDNVDKPVQLAAIRLFLKLIVARFIGLNVWPPFKLNKTKQNWWNETMTIIIIMKKRWLQITTIHILVIHLNSKREMLNFVRLLNWNLIWLVFVRECVGGLSIEGGLRKYVYAIQNNFAEHVQFLQPCRDSGRRGCCYSFFCIFAVPHQLSISFSCSD